MICWTRWIVALAIGSLGIPQAASQPPQFASELSFPSFPGKRSDYRGYERHDLLVDGCPTIIVAPRQAADGKPWVWRAEFFDAFPQVDLALLARGFHLVYINVGNTFGCPDALKHWDVLYKVLTEKHGFSRKPVLEGLSRGGLYCFNWAAGNPEKVGCILADNAVMDFKSWPGGKGKGKGSPGDWKKLLQDYHFRSEAEALAYRRNPVDNLEPLAKANVPLFLLCGDADDVVPYEENGAIVRERYEKLGGTVQTLIKKGMGHHPHGLDDATPVVEFILRHLAARPATAEPLGVLTAAPPDEDDWVQPMKEVHARFRGKPGAFAHFGDSITVSRAFWYGLQRPVKNAPPEMLQAHRLVTDYLRPECWDWKGPQYGNEGQMTIRWAHQNVERWLATLEPEVALIMFGTNDLGVMELEEYESKTRQVVRKCLDRGTIVILSTIPPKHGQARKAAEFAEAVRRVARELKVPLTDYHAEILKRRPDDWDGAMDRFKDAPGDEYNVPTLICRDGVHPSNPSKYAGDYSDEALRSSGYGLRSYLVLLKYAEVVRKVLAPKPASSHRGG